MNIREAKIEDLNDIVSLNKLLFDHDYEFDKTLDKTWTESESGMTYLKSSIEMDISFALVAEENGEIIGYCIAGLEKTPVYMIQDIKIVELENMFIKEEYRRSGIGKILVEKVEEWGLSKGANALKVVASYKNENARSFYNKMGIFETDVTLFKDLKGR